MKHFTLIIFCLISTLSLWAQSPQSFNYQAVARDASGAPIVNQSVSFRISVHRTSHLGEIAYSEVHQATTNAFGLANLAIGQGDPVTGSFDDIEWGATSHFLEVEFDPKGRAEFLSMGTTEMLSVPYAMHATTVEFDQVEDADADPGNEIQFLRMAGDTLFLSQGNYVVMDNSSEAARAAAPKLALDGNTLSIDGGNSVVLSSVGGDNIIDADGDTRVHVEESSDEDIIRFDLAGSEFIRFQEGRIHTSNNGNSVFMGNQAGLNDDQSNNENIFIGYLTGKSNVTSAAGLAMGRAAMENHTSGNFNIALGNYSTQKHVSGANNVSVGAYTLNQNKTGAGNTALGTGAMRLDTSGSSNVSIGGYSLYNGKNLDNNVAIGYYAGHNATGDGNVFIGHDAGMNSSGSNTLYIDNTNTNSPLIYGDFSGNALTINGSLAGTSTLDIASTSVVGNLNVGNQSTDQSSSNLNNKGYSTTPWLYTNAIEAQDERGASSTLITIGNDGTYGSADQIHMVTNGNSQMTIASDGKVGLDKTNPSADLHIRQSQQTITNGTGGIRFEESGSTSDWWRIYHSGIYFSFNRSGNRVAYISGTGSYVTTSDRRFKKNVVEMKPVMERIQRLRPVSYHYNQQEESENKVLGFIAQEVQPLFPELVFESEDGSLGMAYSHLGVIAIQAAKEQQEVIDRQQGQIDELTQQLMEMQKQLQAIQSANNK